MAVKSGFRTGFHGMIFEGLSHYLLNRCHLFPNASANGPQLRPAPNPKGLSLSDVVLAPPLNVILYGIK